MAQQPSFGGAAANPVAVINSQYCSPHPIDLAIVRKVMIFSSGNFDVKDTNGNILFKVKNVFAFMRRRRVLLDGAGNPIATIREKAMSRHRRWQVFRGESSDPRDLIFSAKISSLWSFKTTKLNVFLANNTREDVCDFRVVEGSSWLFEPSSCTIYAGKSSAIVAQMLEKQTVKSIFLGKNNFMVTVHPNVDYAFIVALIVILDEINRAGSGSSSSGGVAGGGGGGG
ncbi:protein LURP-one-related 15 [Citrus sinensis]|uniref:Uncharacterized protein n=1 Tax=Citrus clementina TaxID=85681 RepID=V4SUV3_CITCL|nr:protein LURP-one-related 10 [Citrus x clementina]ESR42770.1 hypothetical protein CICLE_v10012677mg [Citrus x clementina]KAH9673245.1 protein LURP-one-related 15 [Citrus sinensis]